MKTAFTPNFVRDLKKIKQKTLLKKVAEVIKVVEAAETFGDIPDLKKLAGFRHAFRIRVGEYRFGLYCEKDLVEFVCFLHRKDIYRKFP